MVRHVVEQPLPASFMVLSMVGFLFSSLVVWDISMTWGFTLSLMFLIWTVASVYNFTHAPEGEHLDIHATASLIDASALRK